MVKIFNELGEKKTGKLGNSIYQNINGVQVRRSNFKRDKPASPNQIKTRKRFTDAVTWVKNLSYDETQGIKKYFNQSFLSYKKGEPSTWYNFAKNLYMVTPDFILTENTTDKLKITHPGIKDIKIYNETGILQLAYTNLSNLIESLFKTSFIIQLYPSYSSIQVETVTGQIYTYGVSVTPIPEGYTCFDNNCFEGDCWE